MFGEAEDALLMAVDVGNTQTVLALRGGGVARAVAHRTEVHRTADELASSLRGSSRSKGLRLGEISAS